MSRNPPTPCHICALAMALTTAPRLLRDRPPTKSLVGFERVGFAVGIHFVSQRSELQLYLPSNCQNGNSETGPLAT